MKNIISYAIKRKVKKKKIEQQHRLTGPNL